MKKKSKVCLTTYIYGLKYQNYIPLLLYSCHKAYPEYDVILFLYDKLDKRVKQQIDLLELSNNVVINEEHFNDCPNMSPLKSKALRWVLWDDLFNEYDYLYTIDIDMLYIREPIPLHEQHIKHMRFLGMPISNIKRTLNFKSLSPHALKVRLQNAGFKSFYKYLKSSSETRLSGLHFVDVKEYYSKLNEKNRNKFKRDIYSNKYLSYVSYPNNEIFLAKILTELGFDISKMGVQSNPIDMLDYSMPERFEFRPHHGIHLGIFRSEINQLSENSKIILESSAYSYYIEIFKNEIIKDKKFIELSKHFTDDIRTYIDRLYDYYEI